MLILTDGKENYIFYGSKETLQDCYQRDFQVCLYHRGHEIVRKLNGLYISSRKVGDPV